MQLWASIQDANDEVVDPPFANAKDLHAKIDAIPLGETPWQSISISFDGPIENNVPTWKTNEYQVWYRDPLEVMEAQIANLEFTGEIDYAPKRVYAKNGRVRQFNDLMSGDWAWKQGVRSVYPSY